MYAARAAKPKLSLSISAATNTSRPALSLRSPGPMPRTPVSPSPLSPAYSRDFGAYQAPQMYTYTNSSSAKSILKKGSTSSTRSSGKAIQFQTTPTVYCVTPIENKDEYYGRHVKVSRDERRWGARS